MQRLSCPHCGFFRDLPETSLPKRVTRVTCPRCKEGFTFDPASQPVPPPIRHEAVPPPGVVPQEASKTAPVSAKRPSTEPTASPARKPPPSGVPTPVSGSSSRALPSPSSKRPFLIATACTAVIMLAAIFLMGKFLTQKTGTFVASIAKPGASKAAGGDGDYRVIPIPPMPGTSAPQTSGTDQQPGAADSPPQQPSTQSRTGRPENIHVFIYVVNVAGSLKINGTTVREFETRPDMQYNYNMGGDSLNFGSNSIVIDHAPVREPGATMAPRIHLKISSWKGSDRRILGDWDINAAEAGQKSLTLDLPEPAKGS